MLSKLCCACVQQPRLQSLLFPTVRTFGRSSVNYARGFGGRFGNQQGFALKQKVGPTLRERLLGPTTGRPFIYGTYALAGGSAAALAMLCYYGLYKTSTDSASFRMGFISSSVALAVQLWPQYVRDRLQSVYGHLGASLAITAASALAASRSPTIMRLMTSGTLMNFFITLAAILGTGAVVRSISYEDTLAKHAAWLVHAGVMGVVLAPLCLLGGPALVRAAWYTAGVAGGLSMIAFCAPSEKFLNMYGPLAMGLGIVFVSNIGVFFLPPGSALGAGLSSIVIYGGLLLFGAFLLHDTQRVIKIAEGHPVTTPYGHQHGYSSFNQNYSGYLSKNQQQMTHIRQFDPINTQMAIYLDILNIFIRLAMIMAGNRRK